MRHWPWIGLAVAEAVGSLPILLARGIMEPSRQAQRSVNEIETYPGAAGVDGFREQAGPEQGSSRLSRTGTLSAANSARIEGSSLDLSQLDSMPRT